jgi:hypothetical protein
MKSRTKIIGNKIVNSVEQLACFLKTGDIFLRPRGSTQYKFERLDEDKQMVVCENMDTHTHDKIFCNSPVLKLVFI